MSITTKTFADLKELIEAARKQVDAMTEEQKREMIRKQGEGWAKAEAQWAADFAAGKCERD